MRGLGNQLHVFSLRDFAWDGAAMCVSLGMPPQVREIPALLRLHGLNGAIVTGKKHAHTIRLLLQGKAASVMGQAREALNEVVFAQPLKCGEAGHFRICEPHLAGPAAAGRATLAIVKDRHGFAGIG